MSRWSIAKLLELLIASACLFLHLDFLKQDDHVNLLCTVTFVAYTVILLVLVVGYFISKPFSRRGDIFFGVLAIPLFLACGYYILSEKESTFENAVNRILDNSDHKKLIAKGWLAVANGVLFILDVVLHCFE